MTKIAVVIPCYRVRNHIQSVICGIGPEVANIYVVDDACPEQTGAFIEQNIKDSRIKIIKNLHNMGVGGAVIQGSPRLQADVLSQERPLQVFRGNVEIECPDGPDPAPR